MIPFLARNTSELNKYHSLAKSIVERRRAEILPQKISRRNNKIKIFKKINLRVHWRLSMILKTSKKVYEVMFFDI